MSGRHRRPRGAGHRAVAALLGVAGLAVALTVSVALPSAAPALAVPCPTPLPVLPVPVPAPATCDAAVAPTPGPTPSQTPTRASVAPQPEPTTAQPAPVTTTPPPPAVALPPDVLLPGVVPTPVAMPSVPPEPVVAATATTAVAANGVAVPTLVPGVFVAMVAVLLMVALGLAFAASQHRGSRRSLALPTAVVAFNANLLMSRRPPESEPPMSMSPLTTTGRGRLLLGVLCLAAAGVVGLVGWYKIAGEHTVNHQLPYLASAGMAVVVLTALGGALLVAEQLRDDQRQIAELDAAVRSLAATLAPLVEAPPRLPEDWAVSPQPAAREH